jgi:hypothetical protein
MDLIKILLCVKYFMSDYIKTQESCYNASKEQGSHVVLIMEVFETLRMIMAKILRSWEQLLEICSTFMLF